MINAVKVEIKERLFALYPLHFVTEVILGIIIYVPN